MAARILSGAPIQIASYLKCLKIKPVLTGFALLIATGVSSNAATIFSEDFSGTTPGPNSNLAGSQFSVTGGQVDVIGQHNGSFFTCDANPTGNCVDLVGSGGLGTITSSNLSLTAGDIYTISFHAELQGESLPPRAISKLHWGTAASLRQRIQPLPIMNCHSWPARQESLS